MSRSRRSLLKTVGLALGGTVVTTAGCLGGTAPRGAGSPDETAAHDDITTRAVTGASNTPDASSTTAFSRWLPDPTSTPLRDGYGIRYFDVAGVREHRASIHEAAYDRLARQMLRPVPTEYVDAADVDAALGIGFLGGVVFGSFDPAEVGERVTSSGRSTGTSTSTPRTATRTPWAEPDRYEGFDLYGTEYVYAVSPDALLAVSPMADVDAVASAKAIIDASVGEAAHYPDGNEYVASMLGLVEAPHALWCYPEAMDGSTSRGFRKEDITGQLKSWRFGPETTRLTFANTYLDAKTAASGELAEFVDRGADRFGVYEGLDVAVEGRLAWADGTVPTSTFDHLSAGGPADGVTTPN